MVSSSGLYQVVAIVSAPTDEVSEMVAEANALYDQLTTESKQLEQMLNAICDMVETNKKSLEKVDSFIKRHSK